MEPDAAEKELWHYDMTPDAKAAWDANGMDGAVTGESPVIVSFTTMGYDRGYRAGVEASPSRELVKAAWRAVESVHLRHYRSCNCLAYSHICCDPSCACHALAALRTTKEGE